jgi:predicted amidohydrolase
MRAFTAAAVQIAPLPGPVTPALVAENGAKGALWTRRCVEATGAELVVLPETASTGFVTGLGPEDLWDVVSTIPGPVTEPIQEVARELGVHVVWGTYERGTERGGVHNASVQTPLGRIGQIICFDGDYPELSRVTAVRGAEIIVRPSALLRSADIWELTNRSRAYDNHVFVIGANATGLDPAGTIYFGNSMIVTPVAEVIARAASHECWVTARLDPATALSSLTPGSSIGQGFDHLADRNLDFVRRHVDDLTAPAKTPFPHA